jgi:hypothetical protein
MPTNRKNLSLKQIYEFNGIQEPENAIGYTRVLKF